MVLRSPHVELCMSSPPAGGGWLHEIKHDDYRVMARREDTAIHLLTRNGRRGLG
jgi:bifunctional non-homologous end joining protein LigD